nr:hypothetical protein [Rhodocyclus purpureus]
MQARAECFRRLLDASFCGMLVIRCCKDHAVPGRTRCNARSLWQRSASGKFIAIAGEHLAQFAVAGEVRYQKVHIDRLAVFAVAKRYRGAAAEQALVLAQQCRVQTAQNLGNSLVVRSLILKTSVAEVHSHRKAGKL